MGAITFNDWTDAECEMTEITVEEGGKPVEFHWGGPHEEGYSYETLVYWMEDGAILRRSINNAKDCDGRLDRESLSRWDMETYRLDDTVLDCGVPIPHWETLDRSQRDQYAEMAGY